MAIAGCMIGCGARAGESITNGSVGPEFAGRALDQWCFAKGVEQHFIQPGKPMQNGYIESFNGKFRDE